MRQKLLCAIIFIMRKIHNLIYGFITILLGVVK